MQKFLMIAGLAAAGMACAAATATTADAAVVLTNRSDLVNAGGTVERQFTNRVGVAASDTIAFDAEAASQPLPSTVALDAAASGSLFQGQTLVATADVTSALTSSFSPAGNDLRISVAARNATRVTADNLPAFAPDATAEPSRVLLFPEGGYNSDFSFVTTLDGSYSISVSISDFSGAPGDQINTALIVFDSAGDGTFATQVQRSFFVAADGTATRTGTLAASPNRYRVLFAANPGRVLSAGDDPIDTSATFGGTFQFTAVPEPTAMSLLTAAALPLLRRRR